MHIMSQNRTLPTYRRRVAVALGNVIDAVVHAIRVVVGRH